MVPVAGKEVSIETGAAIALNAQILSDIFLQARNRHDYFEGTSGGELRLDGLVQKWVVRVIQNRRPVAVGQTDGELVGVEAGARDHGENFTGVGVQSHDSARLAFKRLLG